MKKDVPIISPKRIKKEFPTNKTKVSHKFITALSIVSITGFLVIASRTLFGFDLSIYTEALLMLIVGTGLIVEAKLKRLKSISHGITSTNITHLITVIVGLLAVIAGVFSIPQISIVSPGFLAIKGIISIIAIAVIIIQTWVID